MGAHDSRDISARQLSETGEALIARDAGALRVKAVARRMQLAERDTAAESATRCRARPAVGDAP